MIRGYKPQVRGKLTITLLCAAAIFFALLVCQTGAISRHKPPTKNPGTDNSLLKKRRANSFRHANGRPIPINLTTNSSGNDVNCTITVDTDREVRNYVKVDVNPRSAYDSPNTDKSWPYDHHFDTNVQYDDDSNPYSSFLIKANAHTRPPYFQIMVYNVKDYFPGCIPEILFTQVNDAANTPVRAAYLHFIPPHPLGAPTIVCELKLTKRPASQTFYTIQCDSPNLLTPAGGWPVVLNFGPNDIAQRFTLSLGNAQSAVHCSAYPGNRPNPQTTPVEARGTVLLN